MMRFHVRLAAGALALLAAALPLTAQEPRWTPLGPVGGSFVSLAVHPTDPRIVYAGGSAGVVKSVDGGVHWTTLSLSPAGELLALDPSRPSTVYATGHGSGFRPLLYKSVDGGVRWASVTDSLRFEDGFTGLAVDPAVPSRVFLGTARSGLWRSLDRGATWELAVQGLPAGASTSITAVAAAPSPQSGTVYVGTGFRGIYRSVNAGASWKRVRGLPVMRVRALAIAPSDPRTVYVSFWNGSLFRTADAGATWRPVQRPGLAPVTHFAVSPRSPGTVYALSSPDQIFRTQDGGTRWTLLSPAVRTLSVAIAPSDAQTVYAGGAPAGTDLGRISRSTDGGTRFRNINEGLFGLKATALALDPVDPGTLWAGVERSHLFRWRGDPPSWQETALWDTPEAPRGDVRQILVLAPETLVIHIENVLGNWLWKTDDSGLTWREIPAPLPELSWVRRDPGDPGVLYAANNLDIFRGDGEGASWTPLSEVPLACGFTAFLVAPVPSGPLPALYAGGADNVLPGNTPCQPLNEARVLRSLDGGATWLPSEGLPKGFVTALAVDPVDPTILYAGVTAVLASQTPGVWKSVDQGKTWARTELDDASITKIAVSPVPGRVYAATPDGRFFRSADGGASWRDWSAGLKVSGITELLVDADDPGRIYASTANGVWLLEETD